MAVRQVRLRRGTTAENDAFTGAIGEITVDTTTSSIRVHDGNAGGVDLLRADMANNEAIATDINFTNEDRTIGGAMTTNLGNPTVLTLGGAGSQVTVAGDLVVTGTTTQTDSLLVTDRLIQLANGAEDDPLSTDDVGIIFTRTLDGGGGAQNPALIFWDAETDVFMLATNDVTTASTDLDAGANFAYAGLNLSTLTVSAGIDAGDTDITNVTGIYLDTINTADDGNTIAINLENAGAGNALTISDDNAIAHFTIDATTGATKTTIGSLDLLVNSIVSLDNAVTINETGADKDFRVEGSGSANALFVQGSDGFVGIANGAPTAQLEVTGDTILDGAVSVNTTRADVDFNVATSNAGGLLNALFVQGSDGFVGINNGTPAFNLDVIGTSAFSDTARFSGDVDIRTQLGTNGITFNKGAADQNTTLLRMDRAGNFSTLTWSAASSRFVFSSDLQIEGADLVLGNGANATSITVPTQTVLNDAGENLTISAGRGNGTGSGGSLIFQTGGANGAALSTALTLDSANLATFTGNLDHADSAWSIGATLGAATDLTLGGRVVLTNDLKVTGNSIISSTDDIAIELSGTNVEVIGNLKVTGNVIESSSGADALTLSADGLTVTTLGDLVVTGNDINFGANDNATIGAILADTTKTLTLGAGAKIVSAGKLQVNGDEILQSDAATVITFSGDANKTTTFAGSVITDSNATVTGGSLTIGNQAGPNASISVPTTNQGGAGFNLTLSSGVGTVGNGTDDGSLILRTGTTNVLTLNTDELATFTGDIDLTKNSPTIGTSVGAGETLTLAGALTSVVATAGDLKVTGNSIISSTDDIAIELSGANVDVLGTLEVSGNIIKNSAGTNAITFSADANADITLNRNLVINGTDIDSEANADVLTLFSGNTGGITLGNTGTITLGATAGLVQVSTLELIDDAIKSSADAGTSLSFAANGSLVTVGGDLKVTGNDILNSGDANAISFSADNTTTRISASTKTILTGALEIEGDSIESSTAEAVTLSGADVTVIGDLTVTGADVILGANANATPTTLAPVARSGANDLAGNTLTVKGGQSTGTGAGGSLVFQTSETGGVSNNVANAYQTVLTLDTNKLATFTGSVGIDVDLTVEGNLTVNGTTTTIDTTQLAIEDPIILLNKNANEDGVPADQDVGIFMERRGADAAIAYWDEGDDRFIFATTTAEATATAFGGTTTLQTIRALGMEMNGGSFVVDSVNNDFVIDQDGVLTSTNTASFDVNSETALVVTEGANVALRVDTTNLDVETSDLLPLADSTYNIGTNANRYATGYFDDLQTVSLTATGALTLGGVVTLSNADAIELTSAVTNGITFRSEIAGAGVDGDATLVRVNSGAEGYRSILWKAATDEFSVESGLNSVGDFGVGTIGAETFVVTASNGNVKIEGDITTDTDEAKNLFSAVTTEGNLITLGGGATVKTAGKLRVTGNEIEDSGDATVITFDGSQNTTLAGDLTIQGNSVSSSGAQVFEFTNADVQVLGDLTVTGADVILGANADATPTTLAPVARSGANDLAGNTLTIKGGQSTGTGAGGSLVFQTADTGGASNAIANAYQTVLTIDTDKLSTFTGVVSVNASVIADSLQANAITVSAGSITTGNNTGIDFGSDTLTTSGDLTISTDKFSVAGGSGVVTLANGATLDNTVDGTLTITEPVVALSGDLKVTGNDIQDSSGNPAITFDGSANTNFNGNVSIDTTKTLTLNSGVVDGAADVDAQIIVDRGADTNVGMRWDEGADRWMHTNDGTNYYNILNENDTLFTLDVDGNGSLTIEQTDNTTILFQGAPDADNQGLKFDIDGNTVELSFEASVKMPGALTLGAGDLTAVNVIATNQLSGPEAVLTNDLQIRSSADNTSAKTAILLNSNQAGTPAATEDVSIELERGDSTNAKITWDEGDDRWTLDQGEGTSNAIVTVKRSEGARPETVGSTNNGGGGDLEFSVGNRLDLTAQQPTAYENEHIYFLNNNGTAGDVDLFTLVGTTYNGYKINFVNTDTVNMTIDANTQAGQTINGQNTQIIPGGGNLTIVAYGTAWYIL